MLINKLIGNYFAKAYRANTGMPIWDSSMCYIEDIQMFLLNMAFISSSEVENIYIS